AYPTLCPEINREVCHASVADAYEATYNPSPTASSNQVLMGHPATLIACQCGAIDTMKNAMQARLTITPAHVSKRFTTLPRFPVRTDPCSLSAGATSPPGDADAIRECPSSKHSCSGKSVNQRR